MSQPKAATPSTETLPNTGRNARTEKAISTKSAMRSGRRIGKKEFMPVGGGEV